MRMSPLGLSGGYQEMTSVVSLGELISKFRTSLNPVYLNLSMSKVYLYSCIFAQYILWHR